MAEHHTSRRAFLIGGAASLGAAAAGVAAGSLLTTAVSPETVSDAEPETQTTVPFYGIHQPGIAEPPPAQAAFLGFDLAPGTSRTAVAEVMKKWTTLSAALAMGDTSADESLVSVGTAPGRFTMTVGISGPGLDALGAERPAPLVDHPVFPGDQIDERMSFGHMFVQLCSADRVYLAGAVRAVRQSAAAALTPRWQFSGFRNADADSTPRNGRNLMGQIDGTNNIAASRATEGGAVWVKDAGPRWLIGGSYVAIRRFRMLLGAWEDTPRGTQDRTIGRHLDTGAPIGSRQEQDPVDLDATDASGAPLIPLDAHIRLAAPRRGAGEEMLRRSYSYSTGQFDSAMGDEDAGLIFVSYQSDPTSSFIPVQQRLADSDALNRFVIATSSSLFAVFPGVQDSDDWYGRELLS